MNRTASRRVLVTGGTGFVGSHLVDRLLEEGYDVVCLVRDPARLRWLEGRRVRIVHGDCSRPETLPAAVKDASYVVHAAGLTKARRPADYYETNHVGTKNLLDALRLNNPGIRRFVLVSSLSAAGPSRDGVPVKDTDPPMPVSDYGKSKLLAEREALACKDLFPVVVLRPSAVYGPRDTDMFELFRWAARGFLPIFSGGERFINLCCVWDLVEAVLLSIECDLPSGGVYFVAEERAYSWSEIWDMLQSTGNVHARRITIPPWAARLMAAGAELTGIFTGKPALTNRQKVEEALQRYWICDIGKIRRDLGFSPAYPLSKGFGMTWRWYREKGWIQ